MSDDEARRAAMACYVGRRPCGCVGFAAVDDPAHARDNARELAACIRAGWTIERQTVAWVRAHWGPGCDQCRPKAKRKTAAPVAAQQGLEL